MSWSNEHTGLNNICYTLFWLRWNVSKPDDLIVTYMWSLNTVQKQDKKLLSEEFLCSCYHVLSNYHPLKPLFNDYVLSGLERFYCMYFWAPDIKRDYSKKLISAHALRIQIKGFCSHPLIMEMGAFCLSPLAWENSQAVTKLCMIILLDLQVNNYTSWPAREIHPEGAQ